MHTPGPWAVFDKRDLGDNIFTVTPDGTPLLRIANTYGDCVNETEWRANARLIAAAPDMLQLIKDFRQWDQDYPKTTVHSKTGEMRLDLLFHRCIDIIAKVEG